MPLDEKRGFVSIMFVVMVTIVVLNFMVISLGLHMRYQERLWQSLDEEIAAPHPCQQTVEVWLATKECLPPLGDYRHAAYLPDAICALLSNKHWQWRGMRCATH